ncbi:MAG: ATP-binding protein [Actinomycetota bacterium]|nr:ATP-binding protein [Actinomycetota bacterium]
MSSEQIEQAVGRDFGPRRFASLCNAVAWGVAGATCTRVPSFTERTNDKDGGIDGDWTAEPAGVADGTGSALLGPGFNVYQYKQREVTAGRGRGQVISGLKSNLKGAFQDLRKKTGRHPDSYVLFTNIEVKSSAPNKDSKSEQQELKDAILQGYDGAKEPRVEIVGAAELAGFLNNLPHLREAYFGSSGVVPIDEELAKHQRANPIGEPVALVGREAESETLSSFLADPEARAMFVSGPQDMGKTRLVLELAARVRPVDAVVARKSKGLDRDDLAALRSPGNEVVVVVEDPGAASADRLLDEVLGDAGMKLLVTLPTAEREPVPGYGRGTLGAQVRHMRLEPLDDEDSRRLLGATGGRLGPALEPWVVEHARGIPGILLAAAAAGPDLGRGGAVPFAEKVGKAFEARVHRELGKEALEALEVLSLLSPTGVGGSGRKELETLVGALGDGPTVHGVLRALEGLEDAGLVRRTGDYVEVVPEFFANHLASAALKGRDEAPRSLLKDLNLSARGRLLDRLKDLGGEEAGGFWDGLFSAGGALADLPSALAAPHLLTPAAAAAPARTGRMIVGGLLGLGVEERLTIGGEARRRLVYALQELLARERTSKDALQSLALLAEAENEHHGSSAKWVFSESFQPVHPLVALPLSGRLGLLREVMLGAGQGPEARKAAVGAAVAGLSTRGIVLHQGGGREPLDAGPTVTYAEAWDYFEELVGLLFEAARSDEETLADAAGEALPGAVGSLALQGRPEKAVERMKELVVSSLAHEAPRVPVGKLMHELGRVRSILEGQSKALADRDSSEEAAGLEALAAKLARLSESLEEGDFETRLKRWAGGGTTEGYEFVDGPSGKQTLRYDEELRALAMEAVEDPKNLPDGLLRWTMFSSDPTKGFAFFRHLGELDENGVWRERLEEAGEGEDGAGAFAGYFGGLGERDNGVGERLDELAGSGRLSEEAVLTATAALGDGEAAVRRIEGVAAGRAVDPLMVHAVLRGRWVEGLRADQLARLIRALAGPGLENAFSVVKTASFYWSSEFVKSLEGEPTEVLWRCLEAARAYSVNDEVACDRLAASLSRRDVERGFELLELLLHRPYEYGAWDAVGPDHGEFFGVLCEADRERALAGNLPRRRGQVVRSLGVRRLPGRARPGARRRPSVWFRRGGQG